MRDLQTFLESHGASVEEVIDALDGLTYFEGDRVPVDIVRLAVDELTDGDHRADVQAALDNFEEEEYFII